MPCGTFTFATTPCRPLKADTVSIGLPAVLTKYVSGRAGPAPPGL